MAKDPTIKDLIKLAKELKEEERREEESRLIVQGGKEFILLYLWLLQLNVGLPEDKVQVNTAAFLEDYPKELEEVLAFYEEMKQYDLRKNFKGFSPSIIDGKFKAHFDWYYQDIPKEVKPVGK